MTVYGAVQGRKVILGKLEKYTERVEHITSGSTVLDKGKWVGPINGGSVVTSGVVTSGQSGNALTWPKLIPTIAIDYHWTHWPCQLTTEHVISEARGKTQEVYSDDCRSDSVTPNIRTYQ